MAMTPEERRQKERERKARQRAEKRKAAELEALPRIGPGGRDTPGTENGTDGGTDEHPLISNELAARAFVEALQVPPSAMPRVALLYTLARDLDSGAVAQRSAIAQRYDETMEKLIAAAKPRERDELDEMRLKFYTGGVDGIDDDPEAPQRRSVRKKA
ncbi:hypothetical protein [Microbacterium arborescens]|uniref:hypothetical protein n=1 Tax=Microbacterium arborescens TaxID=33883 RepID=UPI003C777F65